MTTVAVVAHQGKTMGGGLTELRSTLADRGISDPIWLEVPKSKKAPKAARSALEQGADLVFVWGGDGMVQRCLDILAGTGAEMAVIPAGTANLFASSLGIPKEIGAAVAVGLHGRRRVLDVGVVNDEHFGVMAGAGFDAGMIREADKGLKDRVGRAAYVWTGLKQVRRPRVPVLIKVDDTTWFQGDVTCVLIGNVGTISGGLVAFPDAQPDDGLLDVGVVTAHGAVQWARVFTRMTAGRSDRSKYVQVTQGRTIDVKMDDKVVYQLDGGDRPPTKRLRVAVEPGAITVCVPDGP